MSPFSVISFDADQTLFDFRRVVREALDAVVAHLAHHHGISESVPGLQARRDRVAAHVDDPAVGMLEVRRLSFEAALAAGSVDDPSAVAEVMQIFESVRFGRVYFYDETLSVLRRLSESHPLALLTNGNSDPTAAQIGEYFTYTVLAEACGFRKPDRRIVDVLLAEASIEAGQLIHVGDSLETDVAGALNAGATAVYLNREKTRNTGAIVPHHEIADLTGLYPIVYT